MGKIVSTPSFRIEPEFLRRQFWETADPASFKGYRTPFEKIRHTAGRTQDVMASLMKMSVDAYMDMEEGIVTPPVEDIVAFCKVAHCTPADLYKPDSQYSRPMPREIFASMIAMIAPKRETCGLNEGQIGRMRPVQPKSSPVDAAMGAQLRREYVASAEALQKNIDHLRPLLTAMGYSRDLDDSTDPFYRPAENDNKLRPWFMTGTPLDQMMKDPEGKRSFLDACLNQYQIELENEAEMHEKISVDLSRLAQSTHRAMFDIAAELYGDQQSVDAINGLGGIFTYSDDLDLFGERFIADPSVVGVGTAQDSLTAAERSKKAAALFEAAKVNHSLCGPVGAKEAELLAMGADCALKAFLDWRDEPKTQMLMDWFENWAEIYQLTLQSEDAKDMPVCRGFPLALG